MMHIFVIVGEQRHILTAYPKQLHAINWAAMLLSRHQSLLVNKGCAAGRLSALPLSSIGVSSSRANWSNRRSQIGKVAARKMPIRGQARAFVDWVASAGLRCWQILPMVPPDPMFYSPYSGTDSNADQELQVTAKKVAEVKLPLISKAAARLLSDPKFQGLRDDMTAWRKSHAWIEDSAMFGVARTQPGLSDKAWWDWPEGMRFRQEKAMAEFRKEHHQAIEEFVATQFLFDKQWMALRAYANDLGIKILGDMPIYVGGHSVDVWAHQELFELGPDGHPTTVSGVPPDAFSETGYYCVDAKAETAMVGDWKKGPGLELFDALKAKLGAVPILAEDLGVITADVVQLREAIGAPGMVVLQFAWGGGPGNVHLPHMHYDNSYCYPGTHDNETCTGWFKDRWAAQDGLR
ncbi:glycoside hydrolase superfamily [Dunaliella salina]|uniref:4-alpha-glucanotransferase n=1 Tax=Dunaliella salina TaxID=3046 RepID=A0ABQ7GKF3_DUNSA|nr:glycoside hydrolase superfamily [Dunaliella salina]|eukprot:KAF5835101.1 glycoside hydrolase superfamily [Dunaliella salina]